MKSFELPRRIMLTDFYGLWNLYEETMVSKHTVLETLAPWNIYFAVTAHHHQSFTNIWIPCTWAGNLESVVSPNMEFFLFLSFTRNQPVQLQYPWGHQLLLSQVVPPSDKSTSPRPWSCPLRILLTEKTALQDFANLE